MPAVEAIDDLNEELSSPQGELSLVDELKATAKKMEDSSEAKASPSEPESKEPIEEKKVTGRTRDLTGKFVKPELAIAKEPAQKEAPKPNSVKPNTIQDELKPPPYWKATVREQWQNLPEDVRQEVARREKETAIALQEASEAKKSWQAFRQTVGPFEGMIRAEGSDPIRAIGALLQSAAALRTAPPQHKATLVAQLVKAHAIPIDMLDAALANQPLPQPQPMQQQYMPQQFRDPRVDQLLEQRAQAIAHDNQQEVEKFAKENEFFEELREEIADRLELASRRGQKLSLGEAYERAARDNPEISKVMQQRADKAKADANRVAAQKSRIAASSIRGQPAPQVRQVASDSILDDLMAARDELAGR